MSHLLASHLLGTFLASPARRGERINSAGADHAPEVVTGRHGPGPGRRGLPSSPVVRTRAPEGAPQGRSQAGTPTRGRGTGVATAASLGSRSARRSTWHLRRRRALPYSSADLRCIADPRWGGSYQWRA
jgi:hypothetical protein